MATANSGLAIWRFWAFLEITLLIQNFVYICKGLVLKSATMPSRETLADIFEKPGEFNNLTQQMINFIFVEL